METSHESADRCQWQWIQWGILAGQSPGTTVSADGRAPLDLGFFFSGWDGMGWDGC